MKRVRAASLIIAVACAATMAAVAQHAEAGGGCHAAPGAGDKRTTTISLQRCFAPAIARVDAGASVTFVNDDAAPHTVTGRTGSWGSTDMIATGESVSYAFANAGTYPFACILHPGMVGAIVVGEGGLDAGGDASVALASSAPGGSAGAAAPITGNPDGDGMGLGAIALIAGGSFLAGAAGLLGARRMLESPGEG